MALSVEDPSEAVVWALQAAERGREVGT